MNYQEKKQKQIELDTARGTTHTIEGTMRKKAADLANGLPKKPTIPLGGRSPIVGISPQRIPVAGNMSNMPEGVAAPTGPSWIKEFVEKHYPKNVPLWAYFVTGIIGCFLGAAVGNASGNAISDGILGSVFGFFGIPIVVIGFSLFLRVLAIAAVLYTAYVVFTHLAK